MNGMGEGKDPVYITVSYWYFGGKATNAPLNYRNIVKGRLYISLM
jgi:hypothetical protein